MSNMARTTSSSSSMKGFSVLQPGLGAPLSWMPAVGTKELEQLIHAYLPGPASAREKRATISVDFFEFAAQTGDNFKYYPVHANASQPTSSPANSAVSASPAMSNMSHGSPSQPSTPASRTASRSSAAKAGKTDYSHLPGMKILTTDGQDVTNSLSRGCKTKEQREHAHLMRVLKACDACKKKKIRCDPSHKRRASSQAGAKAASKPAKKAKKAPSPSASQATSAAFTPAPETPLEFGMDVSLDMDFDSFPPMDIDDILAFDPEPTNANMPQDFYGAVPQDFDFFLSNEFTPAMASSTGSFDSPAQPLTPISSGLLPQGDFTVFNDTHSLAFLQSGGQEPGFPYMNSGAHGSNYVDFNLYSPAGSFIDEEPQKLKADDKRKSPALPSEPSSPQSQLWHANDSPTDLNKTQPSTRLADDQQWHHGHSTSTTHNPQESQQQVPGDLVQQVTSGDGPVGGVVSHGDQRPYHGDNGGHDSDHTSKITRPHSLQEQQTTSRHSPVTAKVIPTGLERNHLPSGSLSPVSSSVSTPVSSLAVSPQLDHQNAIRVGGTAIAPIHLRTISPSDMHVEVSSRSTSLGCTPVSAHALPLAASPNALSLTGRSAGLQNGLLLAGASPVHGGLPVTGRLPVTCEQSTTGRLHSPVSEHGHKPATANGSSPSIGSTLAPIQAAAQGHGLGSPSGSVALLRLEGEIRTNSTVVATNTTSSPSGLGLPSHNQQRPALHAMTANVASSSPRRLLAFTAEGDVNPLLPVRQLSGHLSNSYEMLTQLAVFGLVSMLLIMGLTSLLQLHSPIIAELPSFSSLVFLSLLSTLSPKRDAIDSVRSIQRRQVQPGRRWGLPSIANLARVPLACF